MRFLITISLIFSVCLSEIVAQEEDSTKFLPTTVDYSRYDKIALSFGDQKFATMADLAETITKDIDEDYGRYRILFRWVAQNIVFHPKGENKPEKVLKEGTATSYGFAKFLAVLCDEAGVWAEVVEGYGKRYAITDINLFTEKTNHAWLTVELEDSLYLSDIAWAAGKYNFKKKLYIREFKDTYFIPNPVDFGLSHNAKDKKNSLLPKTPSVTKFIKTPIYYESFIDFKIKVVEPLKGYVSKPVHFQFSSEEIITSMQIIFNESESVPFTLAIKKAEDNYVFDYEFGEKEKGEFTILLNEKEVLSFIKFEKK